MFGISEKLNVAKEVYHGIRQTIWKVLRRQTQPTILYIAGVVFTKRPSHTSQVKPNVFHCGNKILETLFSSKITYQLVLIVGCSSNLCVSG